MLNTRALHLAGIDASFVPPPGARIEVDPLTGEPTGLVYELEEYLSRSIVSPLDNAALQPALRQVFDTLLAAGITAVQDASAHNGPREWKLFCQEASSRGGPRPRITLMAGAQLLQDMTQLAACNSRDDWLRIGPLKIMLTEAAGGFHPTEPELYEMAWTVHRRGIPVAIHAIEESAVCLATEAIARAVARLPGPALRHRLEHVSVAPPALLDRIAEVGIAVATQPGFLYHQGDRYLAEVDEHLLGWLYALRAMLRRGIIVAAGSDAPIAPPNPLQAIHAAITRRSRGGQLIGADEQISVRQALVLHTLAPARLAGLDAHLGSITPGKCADLVLLSANPLDVPPEEIPAITVEWTMVDGAVVWERGQGAARAED